MTFSNADCSPDVLIDALEPPVHPRGPRPFTETYAVYLERVRLLLRRYVLALEVGERPADPGPNESADNAALRALFDLPPTEERRAAIVDLSDALANRYEALVDGCDGVGAGRFEQIRRVFGLSDTACDALWLMLAGHVVPEFLWLYRSLWGSPERSLFDRVFLNHVLDPQCQRTRDLLEAFDPMGPLFTHRLVVEMSGGTQEEADGFLAPSRRLIRHLMGMETDLPSVAGLVAIHVPAYSQARPEDGSADGDELASSTDEQPVTASPDPSFDAATLERLRAGFSGSRRFVLIGADNTGPLRFAQSVLADQGVSLIETNLEGLVEGGIRGLHYVLGEARLRGAGLYVDNLDVLDRPDTPALFVRQFFELLSKTRIPLFLRTGYGLSTKTRLVLSDKLDAVVIRLKLPDVETREAMWRQQLADDFSVEAAARLAHVARAYPFGLGDVENALALARVTAAERSLRRPKLNAEDIERACHALSVQSLGQYARRVEVRVGWDDVVLDESTRSVIDELLRFGRFRKEVFERQGYGAKMSYGKGLTALFHGAPGTGKTMMSGLLAQELGLELYRIELSNIVSKYIGETEQRLAQIFDEATVNGMALLFDEADSLFASRTEVKTSVDRYANLEVNFLLQRIEQHEGTVFLTTNFPKSIDRGFMRRIRFKAEFKNPGPTERAKLWERMIPEGAARDDAIPYEALGEVYEFTGGEIRNAVLRAAFYAAEEQAALSFDHLDRAAEVEYREAGRLLSTTARMWADRKVT